MAPPSTPEPARDPEAGFSVADPGKEWRRGRGIPIVPSFDGFRALGVIFVVFSHILLVAGVLWTLPDNLYGTMFAGAIPRIPLMTLFIVSGFVIYLPTVAREGDFGRVSAFAIRRLARIIPAYWVVLGIALILIAVVPSNTGMPGPGMIATHLAFLQTPALLFQDDYALGFGVVAPVWTLSIEIAFYIVLPFVAVAYYRRPFVGLVVTGVIATVWRLLAENSADVAGLFGVHLGDAAANRLDIAYASQFPTWAFSIAAGMTGAWCYVRVRDRWDADLLARRALWTAGLLLIPLGALVYIGGHTAISGPPTFNGEFARQPIVVAFGLPVTLTAIFVALTLTSARVQRPLANTPLRWTADISYGIFLIHFAVIWFALRKFSLPHDGSILTVIEWSVVVYPLSFVYAYLSARFLERPVRRWAHRYGRRQQAAQARAPA